MAETSCTGSNWVPVEFTGYTCDVYPYKGGYEAAKNIPVATCATVVEGEDGSDFLLIGHEMLYFGRDIDRSLINQNQVRHHIHHRSGTVQDDYTRSDVPFGINTGDAFIPFYTAGCAVTFDSRAPTPGELDALPQIVITSKETWDPKQNLVQVSTLQALSPQKRHNYYETDTILATADPTLSEYLLVERAVSSIQISTHFESNDKRHAVPGMAARHPQYNDTTMNVVETTTHQDDTKQHGVPDMAPRHSQFSDK